uniref:Homeobox domain-containing protein n=1 Tax=Anopheles funestus TaxID=62324 RepID=A0A182RWR3_ANOFN
MDKPSRPVRNRKRSRKACSPGDSHRPVKRLFTPEIKRMLKDWLVRRRENPYPNRDEKKLLASETGLTYTQICNWFANWRRKLKNSGNDPIRKTWGNLIKHYNTNARGNVEQFSICSNDSIWGENGEDSQGSRTSSSGEQPYQPHHHHHHHHHRNHYRQNQQQSQGSPSSAKYGQRNGGKPYQAYTDTGGRGGDNNNSDSCRNNNVDCRTYPDYLRVLPEYGSAEDCPNNEDLRDSYPPTAFRIDHCYTPRNYETVFGIPEETRCYKVTQFDGSYDPESGATLEPLILTATPAHYGHPFATKEVPSGGTLYLTPTTTLSAAVTPPISGRSRSSKYKSSIMEKYLRDLGELEPTDEPADGSATMMPVLMAAIPFQQKHCGHARSHEIQLQAQPTMPYDTAVLRGPPSLSKWLESAAKFTPSKHNYIDWECSGKQSSTKKRCNSGSNYYGIADSGDDNGCTYGRQFYNEPVSTVGTLEHQKDELDAAEALTRLANNFRTKFST